jgi:hypothetical protein
MIGNLTKYSLWCPEHAETLDTDYRTDAQGLPTCCPLNEAHTNISGIAIVSKIDETIRKTRIVDAESLDPDTAISCTEGIKVDMGVGEQLTVFDFSKPFPIDVIAAEYFVDYDEWTREDYFDAMGILATDPLIGALTAEAAQGATTINVSPTVIPNVKPGLFLEFQGHQHVLYCIKSMDEGANTIELCEELAQTISAGAEVRPRRPFIVNKAVKKNAQRRVGDLQSGSSSLGADDFIRIYYHHGVAPTVADYVNFVIIYLF